MKKTLVCIVITIPWDWPGSSRIDYRITQKQSNIDPILLLLFRRIDRVCMPITASQRVLYHQSSTRLRIELENGSPPAVLKEWLNAIAFHLCLSGPRRMPKSSCEQLRCFLVSTRLHVRCTCCGTNKFQLIAPITADLSQLPTTNYQLPTTNYQLPTTNCPTLPYPALLYSLLCT